MNYTTNYNLNKPEGTDLYNHLTIDNPNMDTIDAAMYANKLQSVGNATELVSGTVHAITRGDSDQNIFKFKATGSFNAGDTITVDGTPVTAFLTSGQPLPEDAYVISSEVLCVLDGTSLWVYVSKIPGADEVMVTPTQSIKEYVDDKIDALVLKGTPTAGNAAVTVYRGEWLRLGNTVWLTAIVGIASTLPSNTAILQDIPASRETDNNGIKVDAQYGANEPTKTARIYGTALFSNPNNQLNGNTVYFITGQYIAV